MNIVGYQPYEDFGDGLKDHACWFLCGYCMDEAYPYVLDDFQGFTPLYDIDVDEDASCDACNCRLRD